MSEFKFAEIGSKSIALFDKVKNQFDKSKVDAIKKCASKVPSNFVDQNKKVKVVFAGQYSAGKSSILSMMTGVKLDIGEGVTTASCKILDWNGIQIVDTPGIHTQNRPDHDAITYQAIADADLIVFVITNEGFSSHLGEHFRKLAVERGKGREMMLVVNKMESTEGGNTPEQQKVILEKDILPVISPELKPEDLYISFVDLKSYRNALTETDKDERDFLMEASGFDGFYKNLNRFVKEKNLMGRCTTPLYQVEQLLQDAMAEFKSGDASVDGSRHLLNNQRRILFDAKKNIKEQASALVRQKSQEVISWGDDIANALSSDKKQDVVNSMLKEKYDATSNVYSSAVSELEKFLSVENGKIQEQFNRLQNSEFVVNLENAIKESIKNVKISDNTFKKVQTGADTAKSVGEWLAKFAAGSGAGRLNGAYDSFFKMAAYSGSDAHEVILQVGHFFGHKFAPWEAVSHAKVVGQAGKVLGVAGAFVGVALQIWNDSQEARAEKQLLEYRNDIRNSFRSAANEINMKFDESTDSWIAETMDSGIKMIDDDLAELDNLVNSNEVEFNTYKDLLAETRMLIQCVQNA